MALVQNNQNLEDEDKNKDTQGNPISVGGSQEATNTAPTGGAAGNPAQAAPTGVAAAPGKAIGPGQQQAGSSGRFQNLGKFIKANQPGQFGQQFQQKVGAVAQQGQQAIGQAKQQFQNEATRAGDQLGQAKTAVTNAQGVLVDTNAQQEAFDAAAAQLGQGLNAQYQGPENLANQDALRSQAAQAAAVAQAAGSTQGRGALLQKFFAKSGYNAGQGRLDNLLLGSQQGALRNVRQQGRQVGSQLDQAQQEAAAQAGSLTQQASDIQKEALGAGEKGIAASEGLLKTDAEKYAQEALGMYDPTAMKNYLVNQYAGGDRQYGKGAGIFGKAGDVNKQLQIGGVALTAAQRQALVDKGLAGVQGASLDQEALRKAKETGDYSQLLGRTSAQAQTQSGRFNKLAEILKQDRKISGGDILNKGTIGLDQAKMMGLDSQVKGQAQVGADMAYTPEKMRELEAAETDKEFTRVGGVVDQQAAKDLAVRKNEIATAKMKGSMIGSTAMTPAQEQAYLAARRNDLLAKGGAGGWADPARAAGAAARARIQDKTTAEGQAYYQEQLKKASAEALRRILG